MDIFAVGICAACAVVFGALVKKSNREFALVASSAAGVMILLAVLEQAAPLVSQIEGLAAGADGGAYLSVMLKAVGIVLAGQLASHMCKDAGESALAWAVELAAKAAVLAAALPLVLKLFDYLEEIVKL